MATASATGSQLHTPLVPRNTINIEGGLVKTESITLSEGDFLQYDYPLHVQRKASVADSGDSVDEQTPSNTGAGAKRRNTVDLGKELEGARRVIRKMSEIRSRTSQIYPRDKMDSDYISSVRIL
jgi:hypothetical protein